MSRNEHFETGHQKPEYFRYYEEGPNMWGIKAWQKGAQSPGTIAGWNSRKSADEWISKNISPETHEPLPADN